ncbi:hypothetical protein TPY_2223 [Sulfobacillus acidophilus TPY]|nr:hypothetical protein TPY_2223 [Sulfobacillus acidophilus TPY]
MVEQNLCTSPRPEAIPLTTILYGGTLILLTLFEHQTLVPCLAHPVESVALYDL